MPMYSYTCLSCFQKADRICKLEERDMQTCEQMVDRPLVVISSTELAGLTIEERIEKFTKAAKTAAEATQHREKVLCGGQLEREEISITARTPNLWSFKP